jgi:hypothetical protein
MGGKGKSWPGEAWKEDGPSLLGHQLPFTLFLKVHKCYVMASQVTVNESKQLVYRQRNEIGL